MQWCQFAALVWAAVAVPLQPASTLRSKRRIDAATTLRGGFGGALLETYTNLLAKAPLRTNMVTAACLAMTSDAVAQRLCVDTEDWYSGQNLAVGRFGDPSKTDFRDLYHFWPISNKCHQEE